MLKVECPISDFFQLILEVPLKLAPDAIDEVLKTYKILLEEGFKLWPRDWSGALVVALVLNPSETDGAMEK